MLDGVGGWGWVGGVEAFGGEEDEPEVVEGAEVEGEEAVG